MTNTHNNKYYNTVPCRTFNKFLSNIHDFVNKGWIFRGHLVDSWELQHNFERACIRFNVFGEHRTRVETNMIREFKRRLHHYTANTPSKNATDKWLALMQHHGAQA